jgi:hypothetical protein
MSARTVSAATRSLAVLIALSFATLDAVGAVRNYSPLPVFDMWQVLRRPRRCRVLGLLSRLP